LQRFLLHFFFLGTKFNITSLISLPVDMSEVILNLVPRKKEGSKNPCSMCVWRSHKAGPCTATFNDLLCSPLQ
jgi:hypothetical protein